VSDPHRRFFAGWSKFYESTPIFARLLRGQQDEAIRRLALADGERVLDLGCGTGRALQIVPRASGADASLEMLKQGPRGRAACARAERLPFRAAGFDAVVCTNSYHHHPDPLGTLREIRRVLKPGGRAVLVDPNPEHPLSRMTIYGGEALVFGMSVHLHNAREWLALLADAGFAHGTAETLSAFPLGPVSLCIEARA
jgi:demethylmenaquinone methyltransferase/2-methoxy-6-polyprenyl-1,4-benzoquinol methylase